MNIHLCCFPVLGTLDMWAIQVPLPVLLGVAAALGYLVTRWTRRAVGGSAARSRQDIHRARLVAHELERISRAVRRNLVRHQVNLTRFKRRIRDLDGDEQRVAWDDFCREWEELLLEPTVRLAAQIGNRYEELRQQIAQLTMLSEARTDSLTKVNNRRGLDEAFHAQLALMNRYGVPFSVTLFDIDHFKQVNDEHGHLSGDRALQCLAQLIVQHARQTDIVGRYGGDELLVVMPQTDLQGACLVGERLRARAARELAVTVSGGVTTAQAGDDAESLMGRADKALYAAKSAGRNAVFFHDGQRVELVADSPLESCPLNQAPCA
jgi:diguanylate cyclase (GGDEF)-like protein